MGREFTRQELYDLVWREPLRTLAACRVPVAVWRYGTGHRSACSGSPAMPPYPLFLGAQKRGIPEHIRGLEPYASGLGLPWAA
jgi:hypothetical protein